MKRVTLFLSILLVADLIFAQDIAKKHGFNKETLTLSKGKYEEIFTNNEVVQIGTVLINTKTNKVVKFLEADTTKQGYKAETSSRFLSIDPLAEKYPYLSPYVYCLNNPIRWVDRDGRAPGDPFSSVGAAAKDWGNYYNGASIIRGKEFGSRIYQTTTNGKTSYSYSEANIGSSNGVRLSDTPNGEPTEATIHSHGEYIEGDRNNDFSNTDKWSSYNLEVDAYLTTPDGSLKKYDPYTTKTSTISTDLPSDPKDPERKNDNDPTDLPAEERRQQTTSEQDKKPELKLPEHQRDKFQWTF
jgi:hypothetical protein